MQRFLARWLVAIDAIMFLVGVGLGLSGSIRGWFLAALVPLAIAPFTWARWTLHRALAPALSPAAVRALTAGGVVLDVVLFTQLLTARAPDQMPWVHGDGIAWIGPV